MTQSNTAGTRKSWYLTPELLRSTGILMWIGPARGLKQAFHPGPPGSCYWPWQPVTCESLGWGCTARCWFFLSSCLLWITGALRPQGPVLIMYSKVVAHWLCLWKNFLMSFIHFLSSPLLCLFFIPWNDSSSYTLNIWWWRQDSEKAQGFSLWRLFSVSIKILTFLSSLSLERKMKSVYHGDG